MSNRHSKETKAMFLSSLAKANASSPRNLDYVKGIKLRCEGCVTDGRLREALTIREIVPKREKKGRWYPPSLDPVAKDTPFAWPVRSRLAETEMLNTVIPF